jgi:hypothetical protein
MVKPVDGAISRPLPGLPPLPSGHATLIGGLVQSVDHVRDRIVVQAFAGRRMVVLFDERTRIFRDGKPTTFDDLKKGDRAYVDTTLDGKDVFARNIRISTQGPTGGGSGQIVAFDPSKGELTLRDSLSPEPVTLHVPANATVLNGSRTATTAELQPGALVSVTFSPAAGNSPTIRQISIIAAPGTSFVFAGRVEHLDLRRGLLVISDPRDNKSYELYFDQAHRLPPGLRQGANVTVQASFDGKRYQSRDITVNALSVELPSDKGKAVQGSGRQNVEH